MGEKNVGEGTGGVVAHTSRTLLWSPDFSIFIISFTKTIIYIVLLHYVKKWFAKRKKDVRINQTKTFPQTRNRAGVDLSRWGGEEGRPAC